MGEVIWGGMLLVGIRGDIAVGKGNVSKIGWIFFIAGIQGFNPGASNYAALIAARHPRNGALTTTTFCCSNNSQKT